MQRITITLDDALDEEFEQFRAARGYDNRSEAIRDLIRARLEAERLHQEPAGECVANLTYVYNHHERELATRLTRSHHDHHDLAIATLHVHLDHDNCLETVLLRGPADRVRAFADSVVAQPGVRNGRLYILPVEISEQQHRHGDRDGGHRHLHLKPIA
jgi:CopG family nickel-responsive transcriptional regulator